MLVELIWAEDPIKVDSDKWWPEGKIPKYAMLDKFREWVQDPVAYHAVVRVFTQSEYVLACFRLLHIRKECELVIYVGETMVEVNKYGGVDGTFWECDVTHEGDIAHQIIEESTNLWEQDHGEVQGDFSREVIVDDTRMD